MSNENAPSLLIPMRPQISVELNQFGEVVITTSTISDSFENVEIKDIVLPRDCAKEIARVLPELSKK